VVKKKSRASASRAKGAKKGTTKGARKSAAKRRKPATRAGIATAQETSEGLNVKKLKDDLGRAIAKLDDRISKGDSASGLPETRQAFARWIDEIETTMCVGVNGPCGDDMIFGS
jgi:hypothetical protein